jgi:hypothetical protein
MRKVLIACLCLTSAPSFGDLFKDEKSSLVESEEKKENPSLNPFSPQSHEWFLTERALRGDISAMSQLADSYYFGREKSISKNPSKAFYWYKKLAEKDIPRGLNNMGFLLKNGFGCEKSYEKAAQAFKGAIESPLAKKMPVHIALLNLSALYYNGKGVEKNVEKSFDLFEQFVKFYPEVGSVLEILEIIDKEGNMTPFILQMGQEREIASPVVLPDVKKMFARFTRILDKGEETENKLLQLMANYQGSDFSHISLKGISRILKDMYSVLGKPLPQ